ncbi:hypothetical protein PTTG_26201 [Puccinia triticina 1-1 BBBD Race 1]|uniref:Uncharacterized protein n=2 Tax=Puccinia triticina TaxID=208348 RepID=A0A180GVY9_PUCT1|nr:uncharacterized protein PtA15_6A300 [Puccinia triticina]OAV96965.1 hypothetical protein PTTG_26201 [Puccinia triticina 1-1 BBBD Race 1]WAQ85672.1 hypothetical protein PtA15_6A300 [Puccinia triticina]
MQSSPGRLSASIHIQNRGSVERVNGALAVGFPMSDHDLTFQVSLPQSAPIQPYIGHPLPDSIAPQGYQSTDLDAAGRPVQTSGHIAPTPGLSCSSFNSVGLRAMNKDLPYNVVPGNHPYQPYPPTSQIHMAYSRFPAASGPPHRSSPKLTQAGFRASSMVICASQASSPKEFEDLPTNVNPQPPLGQINHHGAPSRPVLQPLPHMFKCNLSYVVYCPKKNQQKKLVHQAIRSPKHPHTVSIAFDIRTVDWPGFQKLNGYILCKPKANWPKGAANSISDPAAFGAWSRAITSFGASKGGVLITMENPEDKRKEAENNDLLAETVRRCEAWAATFAAASQATGNVSMWAKAIHEQRPGVTLQSPPPSIRYYNRKTKQSAAQGPVSPGPPPPPQMTTSEIVATIVQVCNAMGKQPVSPASVERGGPTGAYRARVSLSPLNPAGPFIDYLHFAGVADLEQTLEKLAAHKIDSYEMFADGYMPVEELKAVGLANGTLAKLRKSVGRYERSLARDRQ